MLLLIFQIAGFDLFAGRADGHAIAAAVTHAEHQGLPHEGRFSEIKTGTVFGHGLGGNHGLHPILESGHVIPIGVGDAGHKIEGLSSGNGAGGANHGTEITVDAGALR
jgi:hypothetical protein